MSSIWIVLLDTSGSMDEGFSAQSQSRTNALSEIGAWQKKIDAAKEILLQQVSSLRQQDIAVVQFTDSAQQIFKGTRDELLRKTALITRLLADGGTSIAAAFNSITDDPSYSKYRALSILLLTDGHSDKDEATKAAERLISHYPYARIDTIIIDETTEGRAVVEAVSLNGTVRNATSTIQLRDAVNDVRATSLVGELQNMAALRFMAQQELARIQDSPSPTLLQVTTGEVLNAATLRDSIAPTLLALEYVESARSIASGHEPRSVVSSISQDSPISINLTGIKETIQLFLDYVIPWRRKHAERLASLDIRQKESEVAKLEHENSFFSIDREHREIEITKQRLEIMQSKLELAEKVLEKFDPDQQLNLEQRKMVLEKLLGGINEFSSTKLEFKVVDDKNLG